MRTTQIDTAPANIAAMLAVGSIHAHQDGRWRYSPHGGETVLVNDPTEQFDTRATFGGVDVAACCNPPLFAVHYRDGTRGLNAWAATNYPLLWQLYGPSNDAERQWRAWVLREMAP